MLFFFCFVFSTQVKQMLSSVSKWMKLLQRHKLERKSMRQNKDFTVKVSLRWRWVTHINSKSLSLMHNLNYCHGNVASPCHFLPHSHMFLVQMIPEWIRACLHGFNRDVYTGDDPHQHMKKRSVASDIPLSIAAWCIINRSVCWNDNQSVRQRWYRNEEAGWEEVR